MEKWSPLRVPGVSRPQRAPRARGRRRRHLDASRDDPAAILTERDASAAAEASRAARVMPGRPAWELFGSQPVSRPQAAADAPDAVRSAAHAELAGTRAVRSRDALAAVPGCPARDYGTGPAYNPASMR